MAPVQAQLLLAAAAWPPGLFKTEEEDQASLPGEAVASSPSWRTMLRHRSGKSLIIASGEEQHKINRYWLRNALFKFSGMYRSGTITQRTPSSMTRGQRILEPAFADRKATWFPEA